MTMQFEFDGLEELIKEIDNLSEVTEEIKDEALIAAGDILLKEMQESVYAYELSPHTGQAPSTLTRTKPKDGELFVGTKGGKKQPGYYLYMQEFGFYSVRAGRFIPPKPFASIAFQRSTSKMLDAQVEVMRKGLGMT